MPPAEPPRQDQSDSPGPDEPDSIAPQPREPDTLGVDVELIVQTEITGVLAEDWLEEHVRRAIALCNIQQAQLNLVIVADGEMAELHEQYTGVAGTTDVLTFDLADQVEGASPPGSASQPTAIEGDIILCLDEAKRQAANRNHQPHQELLLYAIHGLMHLLGEDDHDEADYQRMHAREDALLQQLGIGPLFNPKPHTPDTSDS